MVLPSRNQRGEGMKRTQNKVFGIIITMLLVFLALPSGVTLADALRGQIYLYGEQHGIKEILEKELEIWGKFYQEENMRHLFLEYPYYTAEFLNLWMQADDDVILDEVYADWEGTAAHNPHVREFFQIIKNKFPETIFHGTDVGHQYHTTGQRFLKYLREKGLEETEQYILTTEAIEQGKRFYKAADDVYRENTMAQNFIREFAKLKGENIMGIYGSAHIGLESLDQMTRTTPSMANQLKERYGDAVHSLDLTLRIEPVRIDEITINGKEYTASYFGKQDLTGLRDFSHREFWRIENAYEEFKDKPKTGDVLPYNNYPMTVEIGQVFRMVVTKKDGSVMEIYHRSDGHIWNGFPSTEEFVID